MADYQKVKPLEEWWLSLGERLAGLSQAELRPDQQALLEQLALLLVSPTARVTFARASHLELEEEGWAALVVSLAAGVARAEGPFPLPPLDARAVRALDQHLSPPPVYFLYPEPPSRM